jgi:hypothetical protein
MRSVFLLVLLLAPSIASANGAYSHAHISQLAVQMLEPGPLRDLLSDPELAPIYEAGSLFPDSGYAVSDDYGELAHWEPFLSAYVAWLRAEYAGDYGSDAARQHLAFMLGIASHGMADQSYDTMLLARVFEVDGPESSEAPIDQYADYFIVVDEGIVFTVDAWAPYGDLPEIIASASGGHVVTEQLLMDGMSRMAAVTQIQSSARRSSPYYAAWEHYPFLGTYVYDAAVRGSLPWLAALITRYWEVVWARLHGTNDVDRDLVIQTVPEDGGVNWPIDRSESAAWSRIGVFFGYGVDRDATTPLVTMTDAAGTSVPVTFETPYGGRERSLIYVVPDAALAYDSVYTIEIRAGVTTLSGETTSAPYLFSFRTRCAPDRLADCPPLDPPLVAGPGPERPAPRDAGSADAGSEPASGGCSIAPPRASSGAVLLFVLVALLPRRARTR